MANGQTPNGIDPFMAQALLRNYPMPQVTVTGANQVIDIELDSVPGYAKEIVLSALINMDITLAAGGAAPSASQFLPYNFFQTIEVSLGGGPFQRCSGVYYYLREAYINRKDPKNRSNDPSYVGSAQYSIPTLQATAGETVTNTFRFDVKIPLQLQHLSPIGLLPLGNASTRAKVRVTMAANLNGSDQYACPTFGGSGVTAAITPSATAQSWIAPNIKYWTQPAVSGQIPAPVVGNILNVQERATAFVGAGANSPVKFPDPFHYLRLYHVILDGTGAFNTTGINNFELDLAPSYPQFRYNTASSIQEYLNDMYDLYRQPLHQGVWVFDLFSGNDPQNPNGTQTIDGTVFQTLQTQIGTVSSFNTSSPAKIVTYAEALAPVNF